MNRQDMIDAVAKKLQKSRSYATDVVDLFFSANGLIASDATVNSVWITAALLINLKITIVSSSTAAKVKCTVWRTRNRFCSSHF